jgi:spore maturation protein CgeB
MRLVIFGLTVSSSWGNGHATHWRGIIRALARRGHQVTFFERDVPYYARHRDLQALAGADLVLYRDWDDVAVTAERRVDDADAAIVTSYCPDALCASELITAAPGVSCFYDMDTPVTLTRLERGEQVEYLPDTGLRSFDVVLSFTGGEALDALRDRLGARYTVPLYGTIDADEYLPGDRRPEFAAAMSHLGTYAADRAGQLERMLLDVARRRPDLTFLIAGPKYPLEFSWLSNLHYMEHVSPGQHRDFYSSSPFTLNITRGAMARMGYCPQGRLFEAAACETVVISDRWEGLESFFDIGDEIRCASTTDEVLDALDMSEEQRRRMGQAARARVLAQHTAMHRAIELERAIGE